ncbi:MULTISPECIES: hypothetical protein [unclassified Thioalkalivibrio]|uniref:hypothetical protein n=1 Tax=unclassified Thioalkalivibrio TaxID=2621013 RepID=UPI0003815C0D|nr:MULTISPECIES: hypothetical protein [unclassified Thioalkalivibrio]
MASVSIPSEVRQTHALIARLMVPEGGSPRMIESTLDEPSSSVEPSDKLIRIASYMTNEYSIALFGDAAYDVDFVSNGTEIETPKFLRNRDFAAFDSSIEISLGYEAWRTILPYSPELNALDGRPAEQWWDDLAIAAGPGAKLVQGEGFASMVAGQASLFTHIDAETLMASLADDTLPHIFPRAPSRAL